MAQTLRQSIQDFMSAVRSASATVGKYSAALNNDGTVKITVTATGVVVQPNVQWNGTSTGAANDANISGDTVTLKENFLAVGTVDAQQFLNTLV